MNVPDYGGVLRSLHDLGPGSVADSLAALAQRAGAVDVVVHLVDFARTVLVPVPARGVHVELPVAQPVCGTLPGQAFTELRVVSERRQEGTRVWVPILEGSDCTGVLAMTLRVELDDEVRRRCEELGMFAGWAISLAARTTDQYNLVRRHRAMSLAAGRQWDLLPPLRLQTPEVVSNAVLEPAYDVGGDCFDHNVNGLNLNLAIMDAMGHGLESSMTSSLAIGSYRHDRREGQALAVIHQRLDGVLARTYAGERFVTGQLARLDLRSGEMT
ncbi:MAG: PP2C family protein-serine/threonine phosphatase [Actinomycetes bacterium]